MTSIARDNALPQGEMPIASEAEPFPRGTTVVYVNQRSRYHQMRFTVTELRDANGRYRVLENSRVLPYRSQMLPFDTYTGVSCNPECSTPTRSDASVWAGACRDVEIPLFFRLQSEIVSAAQWFSFWNYMRDYRLEWMRQNVGARFDARIMRLFRANMRWEANNYTPAGNALRDEYRERMATRPPSRFSRFEKVVQQLKEQRHD